MVSAPPPPPRLLAITHPCSDPHFQDMKNVGVTVNHSHKEDFTGENQMSFESQLCEIDMEINYVPKWQGITMPAGATNQTRTDGSERPIVTCVGPQQAAVSPKAHQTPLGDISNKSLSPKPQTRSSTGTWKKLARGKGGVTGKTPTILAEKRNSSEVLDLMEIEKRQCKSARLYTKNMYRWRLGPSPTDFNELPQLELSWAWEPRDSFMSSPT